MPWVIVELGRQRFGLPSCELREIVPLPEVSAIPGLPPHVRGVLCLRDEVLTLIDLRMRLGMPSRKTECTDFTWLIHQREQDHRRWLAELSASIAERRPFTLTLNPHECAFGRWYDSYVPTDTWVASTLKQFDGPHRSIHELGAKVESLKNAGLYQDARRLMERKAQSTLAGLVELFTKLKGDIELAMRELAAVLIGSHGRFALTVDSAIAVEKFRAGCIQRLPGAATSAPAGAVRRIGTTGESGSILLIEIDELVAGTPELAA